VVGTQALIQAGVEFMNLGLAVVDEQHRFGVLQRAALQRQAGSAEALDVLVMSATPIPRTLALTLYGDLDVSTIDELPPGRTPIRTTLCREGRREWVHEQVREEVAAGHQAYVVYPLVEESEKVDLRSALESAERIRAAFPDAQTGVVHGRLAADERAEVMDRFTRGAVQILVSTTVIEVGVDVPEASVMVVEHAERFGLAQLHQLRGRIGRGAAKSTCLLVYHPPLGATAKERLAALRQSDDGFFIAEEDLRLRGAGELLGVKQSGVPAFRFADLAAHGELLAMARDDAKLVLNKDSALESKRGKALRVLLYLFERDEAVRYLRSG